MHLNAVLEKTVFFGRGRMSKKLLMNAFFGVKNSVFSVF